MRVLYPFIAVLALIVVAFLGGKVTGLQYLLGVVLPYLA
ncbi:MAG: menaquinol oxidoreductase, partial [Desulfurivibrio sp.]